MAVRFGMGRGLGGLFWGAGGLYGIRRPNYRYFAFRNLDRLRSLNRWNILFGLIAGLAGIAITVGITLFVFWLFLLVFSLGQIGGASAEGVVAFMAVGLVVGVGLMVVSLFLRWLIEKGYLRAERKELAEKPEGAEKFLAVMKANSKVFRANLWIWAALAVGIGIVAATKFNEIAIISIIIASIVGLIVGKVVKVQAYGAVRGEIEEIRQERKENKKLGV